MTPELLKQRVDTIINGRYDPEEMHSNEDDLHLELIKEFCPRWVVAEVERLSAEDFPRHCA